LRHTRYYGFFARVVAGVAGLGIVGEALLFLTLIDSSSTISIALAKTLQNEELRALAIVETNFEDLAQFIAFSIIFVAGISRPTIESVAVSVLEVAGLLAFLAYTLSRFMKRLRVFTSRIDPGSKYLLFLSIALLYSLTAPRYSWRGFCTLWGFPSLFRAPHGCCIMLQAPPPAPGRCGLIAC